MRLLSFLKLTILVALLFPKALMAADAPAVKDPSLLLYYTFDKNDGDVVKDSSGKGHFGTVNGGKWEAKGKSGGGWRSSGETGDYIEVDCSDFPELKAFTIGLWVRLDKLPDEFGRFFDAGQHCGFMINPTNQNSPLMSYITFDGTDRGKETVDGNSISAGDWHHVVTVWNGKVNQIWVDGVKHAEEERVGKMTLPWEKARIAWLMPGVIDEVKFYSRALSEKEIVEDFKKYKGAK